MNEENPEQATAEEGLPPTVNMQVTGRYKSEFFEWGEALVVSLAVIILLFTFAVRLIGVEGSSMFPTLHDSDKVLMSGLLYEPKKGDIVVVTKDSFMEAPIVKRIIATSGDTVDVDFTTGTLMLNGEPQTEAYINELTLSAGDMVFPQTVPENCVFVMGDNRNKSTDSRWLSLGMVDERYILGHVLGRVWPLNRLGAIGE